MLTNVDERSYHPLGDSTNALASEYFRNIFGVSPVYQHYPGKIHRTDLSDSGSLRNIVRYLYEVKVGNGLTETNKFLVYVEEGGKGVTTDGGVRIRFSSDELSREITDFFTVTRKKK